MMMFDACLLDSAWETFRPHTFPKAKKKHLRKFRKDLYWSREVLAREIGLLGDKGRWKLTEELKQLAWDMFSPACNTKRTLEDTFNVLHSVAKTNPNTAINRHRVLWECHNLVALRENPDWYHLRLPSSDWSLREPVAVSDISDGMFSAAKTR
jgi:hypothetical protein